MAEPQVVASRYALWKAAIKWPMYSAAVMPALLSAGWLKSQGLDPRLGQLLLFLLSAVLLLAWENLSNDVFDADTGIDAVGKPHSVVALTGRRPLIALISNLTLVAGLCSGVMVGVYPALLADERGPDQLSLTYPLTQTLAGLLNLGGPPLLGLLASRVSTHVVMLVLGSSLIIGSVPLTLSSLVRCCR